MAREAGHPSLYWDMTSNFLLGITVVIPSGFGFDLTYHVLHKLKKKNLYYDIMHFVFNSK